MEKRLIFTFSPYVLYFCPRGFFFFQIYENYCKKTPNGEILKKVYLAVWSRDNIKVDFFSFKRWHIVVYILL